MNINLIYVIVAILMLISFVIYIGNNQPTKGWRKRFHSIMQVLFFIANLIGLAFINENPYKPENAAVTYVMIVVYAIPIVVYTISFIYYYWLKRKADLAVLWGIYILGFIVLMPATQLINSEKILQEKAVIISYKENEVQSTFLNNSIEGTDYVIVKESSNGETTKDIIETRTYRDDNDIVRLHLHQNNSHIEEYVTVDTYISFLGFTTKEVKEEKIYEIYLTDDMYEQK